MTAKRTASTLLLAPVVAVIVLAGVWVAGGVIAEDLRTSMLLTTAWFALAGGVCLALALRLRAVRVPVLAGYLVTATAAGAWLGLNTLRDDVVDEQVVMAAAAAPAPGPATAERRAARPEPANVRLARGRFRSGEHATSGTATVVRVRGGRRYLTLTSFATSAGPDLRVRLVPGDTLDGGAPGAVDLGALKGNKGDQQYRLPAGTAVRGRSVVIWCRAFSAPFGGARLR
jgi:hypothetical protein